MLSIFLDDIIEGATDMFYGLFKKMDDYSTTKPKMAIAGKVLAVLGLEGTILAAFVLGALNCHSRGEMWMMWIYIICAALAVLLSLVILIRHLLRNLRQYRENMYDPRFQK